MSQGEAELKKKINFPQQETPQMRPLKVTAEYRDVSELYRNDWLVTTGRPDVVFDFGDYVMSSADKTMYENTLNIALNRTYTMFVLHYFDISVLLEWV